MGEIDFMEAQEIILYPLMSEVASRIIESENKLVFVVSGKSTKKDVKRAISRKSICEKARLAKEQHTWIYLKLYLFMKVKEARCVVNKKLLCSQR
jgi:hypothetical protein